LDLPGVLKMDKRLLEMTRVVVREVGLRELLRLVDSNPLTALEGRGQLVRQCGRVDRLKIQPKLGGSCAAERVISERRNFPDRLLHSIAAEQVLRPKEDCVYEAAALVELEV